MAHFRNCYSKGSGGEDNILMAVESFKFINHKTQGSKTVCSITQTILAGPSLFPQSYSSSEDPM